MPRLPFRAPPPMPVRWEAPPLPPAAIVTTPGRGEHFVRRIEGPGSGPTVLLLHGWGATADLNWFTTFPALAARGWSVLAPDLLGHGRGPQRDAGFEFDDVADDLAALVVELGTGPVVVTGYSMGSAVACHLAARHPHLVTGVVVAAFGDRLRWWDRLAHGMHGRALARSRRTGARRLNHYLVDRAVARRPDLERHRGWVVAEIQRGNPRLVQAAAGALATFDVRALAPRVSAPVAAVVTTHDSLMPPRRQRALVKALGADAVLLDADHDAPVSALDFGDRIAEAVGLVATAPAVQEVA